MARTVALLGAFDTKGTEYAFVKTCIERGKLKTLMIDTGVAGEPLVKADISADAVARAGGSTLETLRAGKDRGKAMAVMSAGAAALIPQLFAEGKFDGILALGGTGGTAVACAAMRALPLGVPKVMVSTVAGGDVGAYVGVKDIVMIRSIVDVSGINRISRDVFARAAACICGMIEAHIPVGEDKPLLCASMFGNTTPAVEAAKQILASHYYETLVFHCTGNGGKTMESLIESGRIAGVLDITTTELADELVGGVLSAGPTRLTAAAECGVPQVVSVGATDMVNFHAPPSVPERFRGRLFYPHNPNVTLMRTTAEECGRIGADMGRKLARAGDQVSVLIPRRGVSAIDRVGQAFDDPAAREALVSALRRAAPRLDVREFDLHINDGPFAEAAARRLLEMMR
jgi:uncharacterized protein (UPF0261 family)